MYAELDMNDLCLAAKDKSDCILVPFELDL